MTAYKNTTTGHYETDWTTLNASGVEPETDEPDAVAYNTWLWLLERRDLCRAAHATEMQRGTARDPHVTSVMRDGG